MVGSPAPPRPKGTVARGPKLTRSGPKRRLRNVGEDLHRALREGYVELNLAPLSVDEMLLFAETVDDEFAPLKCLKLMSVFKGVVSDAAQRNLPEDDLALARYANPKHAQTLLKVGELLAHERVRKKFPRMLGRVVARAEHLQELEVGFLPSPDLVKRLAKALGLNQSLKSLSLAGSGIGDQGLQPVLTALKAHTHLEELVLTGCDLSDESGMGVAGLIKSHASRRAVAQWQVDLRKYPVAPEKEDPELVKEEQLERSLALGRLGGLMYLDVGDNKLTDKSMDWVINALLLDVQLVVLNLRKNRLSAASLDGMMSLLKEHPRLARVDMRDNADKKMGILRGPGFFMITQGYVPEDQARVVHEEPSEPQRMIDPGAAEAAPAPAAEAAAPAAEEGEPGAAAAPAAPKREEPTPGPSEDALRIAQLEKRLLFLEKARGREKRAHDRAIKDLQASNEKLEKELSTAKRRAVPARPVSRKGKVTKMQKIAGTAVGEVEGWKTKEDLTKLESTLGQIDGMLDDMLVEKEDAGAGGAEEEVPKDAQSVAVYKAKMIAADIAKQLARQGLA